jgi:hypothetical protein
MPDPMSPRTAAIEAARIAHEATVAALNETYCRPRTPRSVLTGSLSMRLVATTPKPSARSRLSSQRKRPMPEPHPAVAAVLAVTPLVDGMAMDGEEDLEVSEGTYSIPRLGPAAPIAARQAAALLREHAAWLRPQWRPDRGVDWVVNATRARADGIEAQYATTEQDGRS